MHDYNRYLFHAGFVCIALALQVGTGQQVVSNSKTESPILQNVRGIVINQTQGNRITGATVVITSRVGETEKNFAALTDNTGTFSIEHVYPGEYTIMALKAGASSFRIKQSGKILSGNRLVVGAKDVVDLQIELLSKMAVSGRIREQSGSPVTRVRVQLIKAVAAQDVLMSSIAAETTTDETGAFRMLTSEPGSYIVRISSDVTRPSANELTDLNGIVEQSGIMPSYFGGVDGKTATRINVQPDQEIADLEIVASVTPFGRLEISMPSTAQELSPVSAVLYRDEGLPGGAWRTKKIVFRGERSPRVLVAPGQYYISVRRLSDHCSADISMQLISNKESSIAVECGTGIRSPLTFQIKSISDSSGAAMLGRIVLTPMFPNINASILTADIRNNNAVIEPKESLDYRVSIENTEGRTYLREIGGLSTVSGFSNVLNTGTTYGGSITTYIDTNGAQLVGSVEASEGIGNSRRIVVMQLEGFQDRYSIVNVDSNGVFMSKAILPGRYRLFAIFERDAMQISEITLPELWRRGARIDLHPGQNPPIKLAILTF